jgi:transposase
MDGFAAPFERAFTAAGITYYTIPAYLTRKVREGLLGENKSNEKDAESVAQTVHSMFTKNLLEQRRGRYQETVRGLRTLTRTRTRMVGYQTALKNALHSEMQKWCTDLALFLSGNHPAIAGYAYSMPAIRLLANKPDIGTWKDLDDETIIDLMETGKREKTLKSIERMRTILESIGTIPSAFTTAIGIHARAIVSVHATIKEIEARIIEAVKDNALVSTIDEYRGVGRITAAAIVAEIQDKRFTSDDNLASYAGLCCREDKTGTNDREKTRRRYNRYLKDGLMQAAAGMKNVHGDPVIKGFYKSLVRRGLKKIEAQKRIARGFARAVFKILRDAQVPRVAQ